MTHRRHSTYNFTLYIAGRDKFAMHVVALLGSDSEYSDLTLKLIQTHLWDHYSALSFRYK